MKTCEGKESFDTWQEGNKVFNRVRRRRECSMRLYKCAECGKYHIGTALKSSKYVQMKRAA